MNSACELIGNRARVCSSFGTCSRFAILDCEYVPRVNRLRSFGYMRPNDGAIVRDFADLDAAPQIDGVCPCEIAERFLRV